MVTVPDSLSKDGGERPGMVSVGVKQQLTNTT